MIYVERVHYQLPMCFHLINKKFFCINIVYIKVSLVYRGKKYAHVQIFVPKNIYVNQNIEAQLIQCILLVGNVLNKIVNLKFVQNVA